ncbi:ABC transporter permease [uncultured Ruegeria sp.]|uniref:ABC transporter permease n=1 Tax=uncultured Ruegeria sp. TaxID=259304 RepID=UPI002617730A|nr:ABC transporter permease [uncultured Ruegeria sp.]
MQELIQDIARELALVPPGWGGNLLRGLLTTLQIAFGAYALALVIGIGGMLGKVYGGPVTRLVLEVYTTAIRAVPELIVLLLLYYAGTDFLNFILAKFGHDPVDINALLAGILVIGIVQGAFCTEVFRGAIRSIPVGQVEAAQSFGMPFWQRFRRIILPIMTPRALPGLSNLWLITTKDTALLAVIGFSELALTTKQAAGATKSYFLFYMVAAVLYLCVTLISNVVLKRIERHYRRGQKQLA